jgi:Icc-related predicted phosphoesterase
LLSNNNLYLFKLKEWQINHNIYFDYLFFLGNFLSFSDKDKTSIKEIANDEAQTGGLLSYLENLCLKIIYIGGISDIGTLFQKPYPSLTVKSINIHNDFLKLADDLYVIGYGGNINDDNKYQLKETFDSLHKYIKENDRIKNIQTILINNDYYNGNPTTKLIYEKIIKNKKNKIFLNLNGCIEEKQGAYKLFDIDIVNPGSINNGNFVIVDLERDINNNSWKVKNIENLLI